GFPVSIDALDPSSHDRSGIGPLPAHASFFHACIDDDSNGAFDQATAHWISLLLPLLVIAQPVFLRLQIPDGILQSRRHFSSHGAQAVQMRKSLFTFSEPSQRKERLLLLF